MWGDADGVDLASSDRSAGVAERHPRLRAAGLTFRTVPTLRIEGLFFSTFFGGGDASWATPRDQYADFAGFELATHRIG